MRKKIFAIACAAVVGLSQFAMNTAAHAITIVNQESTARIFTIIVKDVEWDITIQSDETLSHLCRTGCSIALGYDEDQDFQGNETVEIMDGKLIVSK